MFNVIINKVVNTVTYGRMVVDTHKGRIEVSYQTGSDIDENYQIEVGHDVFNQLSSAEADAFDELVTQSMFR